MTRIVSLLLVVVFPAWAHAQAEYIYDGDSYDSLAAAEAAMHAGPAPASLLRRVSQTPGNYDGATNTATQIVYQYAVPDEPTQLWDGPNPDRYQVSTAVGSGCNYDQCFSDEQGMQAIQDYYEMFDCEATLTPQDAGGLSYDWFLSSYTSCSAPDIPPFSTMPTVGCTWRIAWIDIEYDCPNTPPGDYRVDIMWQQALSCSTSGLYIEVPNPPDPAGLYCGSDVTATITARLNQSKGDCVGNPCDAGTGNKIQSEVDYAGPALRFSRTYHSTRQIGPDMSMAPGWIHSYQRHLLQDAGGNPVMAVREDGSIVSLRREQTASSAPYYAWFSGTGDPFQIRRESASEWVLITGDGRREFYAKATGRLLRLEDRSRLTTLLAYTDDVLTTVTGPFGHTLSFEYVDGQLDLVRDPGGNAIDYQYYPGTANLVAVDWPGTPAATREYHYEDLNHPHHLTGITDEAGQRFATYEYDLLGRAIRSEHAGGVESFSMAHNADGTTTVFDAEMNESVYEFGEYGAGLTRRASGITLDGLGTSREYQSAGQRGRLTSFTDERGVETRYEYTGLQTNQPYSQQLERRIEAAGTPLERVTTYAYLSDIHDLPTLVSQPSVAVAAGMSSFTRDTVVAYGVTETVDSQVLDRGEELPRYFEVRGYTPDGATAISRRTALGYNLNRQVALIDGPRTDVDDIVRLDYYDCATGAGCGQLSTITRTAGSGVELVTTFDDYDAHGRVRSWTGPTGLRTEYTYDARGRVTTIVETPPASSPLPPRISSYTYHPNGPAHTFTSPAGRILTFEYDAALLLERIVDENGDRIEYRYDPRGNLAGTDIVGNSGKLRLTIGYEYDTRSRLKLIDEAGSLTQLQFDALGNLTRLRDPNQVVGNPEPDGPATEFVVDELNRQTRIIDELNGIASPTLLEYDVNDANDRVVAPNGAETDFDYDDLGNLRRTVSADTGTTTFEYDAAGNQIMMTDARGIVTTHRYDEMNRLLHVAYPDSALDVEYFYDETIAGRGNLTTMIDAAGSTETRYDGYGRIATIRRTVTDSTSLTQTTFETSYAYDESGNVTAVTYPAAELAPQPRVVVYERDPQERVMGITTDGGTTVLASQIEHLPFGPVAKLTYGNGLRMEYSYDLQYRIKDHELFDGAGLPIEHRLYGPDPAGNFLNVELSVPEGVQLEFEYDALHRLESAVGEFAVERLSVLDYAYDENGNRLSLLDNASLTTLQYEPQTNRLDCRNGDCAAVALDAAGNTTHLDDLQFDYSDAGRLATVRDAKTGAEIARYAYNGLGQRVEKQLADGQLIRYWYGLGGELLAETDGAGAGLASYVWLGQKLVAILGSDRDGDGLADTEDNCIDYANGPLQPDDGGNIQLDTDGDGYGNGCDADIGQPNDGRVNFIDLGALKVAFFSTEGDPNWNPDADFNGDGAVNFIDLGKMRAQFFSVPGPSGMQSAAAPLTTSFVQTDHLDTPYRVRDAAGDEVWSARYRPFGAATVSSGAGSGADIVLNIRFPGQYYDDETKLHYNYFRTYDPRTGRYMESDPTGLRGGLNTYAYAMGNPLRFIDPRGLEIVGQWVQQPIPFVSDASVAFGGDNARRPDDWWKIWDNLGTYKAMEHRVSVKAGFSWKVTCTDSDECTGADDEWDLDGGWEGWMDAWVPISTPAIPHPGGYYAFLARNTYSLLVRPATSQVMEVVTQGANAFGQLNAPTWICKNYPRPGN